MPYDNYWHTDVLHWVEKADDLDRIDQSLLKGSLYDNMVSDPTTEKILSNFGIKIKDWDYVALDAAGFPPGSLNNGMQVIRKWSQKALVIDKYKTGKARIVAQAQVGPFSIVGTYPNLDFKP